MKNKKILFYGNCHLSTIARWLHEKYSDKFDIIDCEQCGVHPSQSTKNFAIWMDSLETQKNYYNCVHEKIKQVDYFVFQAIEGRAAINELKTNYLIENILTGTSIAVPNFRFYAYPVDRYAAIPFVKYIFPPVDPQSIIYIGSVTVDANFQMFDAGAIMTAQA